MSVTEDNEELRSECDQPTGHAGIFDDSIYITYPDKEVGPLCCDCRDKHWVCEECGEGVYPNKVTYKETHEECGGQCS